MSVGLKKHNTLYHGTSSSRAISIKNNGFQKSPVRYDRWLAPDGIYFVPNRPLIALRFALAPAQEENCEPTVLSVDFDTLEDDCILDLTSDSGLYELYSAYNKLHRIFKQTKHKEKARTPDSYTADLLEKIDFLESEDFLSLNITAENSCNWDSAALRYVAMIHNCKIIVAAIQEGTTFSLSYFGKNVEHRISRNYKGLGFRDHIEVCVVDTSIFANVTLKEHAPFDIKKNYDDGFLSAMLDIRNPDTAT